MEPINYLSQVADPFAQATQGLKLGAGMADLQQQQVAREQQQRQQQLAAQEQARFFTNPNPTMRDAARYASLLSPEQSKAFLPFMEGISKEQQQNTLKNTGQLLSALQTNPQVFITKAKENALAARNSGDEEDATLFEQMAEAAADPQRGPAVVFKSLAARTAGIPGAKEMFETIDKSLSSARAEALAPPELQKKIADANAAVADAEKKVAEAKDTPARLVAEQEKRVADANKAKVEADVALATKPSVISEAASKADKARVEAAFAERLQQAGLNKTNWDIKNLQSQIGDRAAKLNLDRQTTQATVAEKLSAIQQRLTDIPDGAMKLINEAATQSATSKQAATQYNDLAQRIESAEGGKGRFTSAAEWFAAQTGRQDAWTQIRNEYTRIRNTVAIKSLPPGPATDADIQLALRGIPPETANAATLASFLRGTAKLQDIDSAISNAKTDWLSQNKGVLTRAKTPFIAGDYAAKPGETFNDFTQRIVADVSAKYRPAEQVTEERRQQLISQIPTNQAPAAAAPSSSIEAQADAIIRGGR
jgi:hypothetical protein